MQNSFLSNSELVEYGFKTIGKNVLISKKASIYSPQDISIGNNVRIDDFCILSGEIQIDNNIHISAYTALYGKFGIIIKDFVTISGRVSIYSQSDDYSGEYMTNPMIPEKFINVSGGKVIFEKHSIVASGSIIFPNLTIGEGAAIGAMSLVNKSIDPWGIYAGIPAKFIKTRLKNILKLEEEYLKENNLL